MREAIRTIGDAKVEFTLNTLCLGTCRTTHILRVRGAELAEESFLDAFETNRMAALRELFPGIEETGRAQAKLRPRD